MSNKEKSRKKIVGLVFLIYWMLIFEGAVRKWFLPEFNQIIFFLRDPVVLLVYILAWRNGIIANDKLLKAGLLMALLFIPLIFIQHVVTRINILVFVYGWRVYFFYIPLAFVIKAAFLQDDINRFFRQTLYVAIPLSALVYIQFISPKSSFVNAAYNEAAVFMVAGDKVRTTGTFSFTAGQTFFASSLMAMLAYVWLYLKQSNIMSKFWLLIATAASMAHLLLSGSRTAFFMTGLIVAAMFFGLMFTRGARMKFTGIALLVFLFAIGTVLFLGPFRESFDAIGARFESAAEIEGSPIKRAFAPMLAFVDRLLTSPIIGHGVGLGTGGGSQLAMGKASITLAEDEWSRLVMESGPLFGLAYIIYRIVFTISLTRQAMSNARDNNLLPMILLGFIGFYLLAGQITHQGTMLGYNWIFVGLIMAAGKKQLNAEESKLKARPVYPNIVGSC